MTVHEYHSEEEIRSLLARLISGAGEPEDEELLEQDPVLAEEVGERLGACGLRLFRKPRSRPLVVVPEADEGLGELAKAALALAALVLGPSAPSAPRPRISLSELAERLPGRHDAAYIRRAVLGPLEQRGLVRVIKPQGTGKEPYIVAGSALGAVDESLIRARLEAAGGRAA